MSRRRHREGEAPSEPALALGSDGASPSRRASAGRGSHDLPLPRWLKFDITCGLDRRFTFPKEGAMLLGDMLERFILDAPMPVLFRLLMERALDPGELDRMFESTATSQYTREVLFSSIVDLMAAVVCRVKPSVRRA